MNCSHCQAEIPAHAQFCMRCGAPAPARPASGGPLPVAPLPVPSGGRGRAARIAAALAVLAAVASWIVWARWPRADVVKARGAVANPGPLTERSGRVADAGPLAERGGIVAPAPPKPIDVIDYLQFLKDIERQRVLLVRRQLGEVLAMSTRITAGNLTAQMEGDESQISGAQRQVYDEFQQSLGRWSGDWQQLSAAFLAKPAPGSCAGLRDAYLDLLGKTAGAIAQVGGSLSQALGGDPQSALQTLSGMQGSGLGSASQQVADACRAADEALAAVCDRFGIRKDFDIRDEAGGGNLLGR
ncbi:MAG: zinc ribbon domain-containing protein [Chthonomonadales bacterium]|nr:zinc ribbon domain-containing protein [Chthonomonadales bacterium]